MIDFPNSPTVNQQFTAAGTTWVWDGTAWNIVPQMMPAMAMDTPPANPAVGQFWWRSTNGQLYVYVDDGDSKQWVQAAGQAGTPGLWEPIFNANGGIRHTLTAQASYDIANLAAFRELRMIGSLSNSVATAVGFRTSSDNGATFYAGASDYSYNYLIFNGATSTPSSNVAPTCYITNGSSDAATTQHFEVLITNFNQVTNGGTIDKGVIIQNKGRVSAAISGGVYGNAINNASAMNALRILVSSGTLTGTFLLEGVRG